MSSKSPNDPGGPPIARGHRTLAAYPAVYKGSPMRSQLEVLFAQALDAREIAWEYEPERLHGGNYLVDFHLPDLRCWVEVKGRFEARDHLLLPLVAGHLKEERKERLFLYMKTRAFRVTAKGFELQTLDAFWADITQPPEDELILPDRRPREDDDAPRKPWRLR